MSKVAASARASLYSCSGWIRSVILSAWALYSSSCVNSPSFGLTRNNFVSLLSRPRIVLHDPVFGLTRYSFDPLGLFALEFSGLPPFLRHLRQPRWSDLCLSSNPTT